MGAEQHTEEHTQADDLIDYLQLIFHNDLGDEHMERFETAKGFDLDYELAIELMPTLSFNYFYPILYDPCNDQSDFTCYDDSIPIPKKDFLAHIYFRGPPVIV